MLSSHGYSTTHPESLLPLEGGWSTTLVLGPSNPGLESLWTEGYLAFPVASWRDFLDLLSAVRLFSRDPSMLGPTAWGWHVGSEAGTMGNIPPTFAERPMPEVSLSELVGQFRSLNPTGCTTEELTDLQHRMGTVVIDDPDMKSLVSRFFLLDAATASDEDISSLQAQMGLALERVGKSNAHASPEDSDPMTNQSARKWISKTAQAMGVADEGDGLLLQTGALTGWIHEQMSLNEQNTQAFDTLRSMLESRGYRADGDATTLVERCKLMALEDKDLLNMRQVDINLLKERLTQTQKHPEHMKQAPQDTNGQANTQNLETVLSQIQAHILSKKEREGQVPTLYELRGWEAALQDAISPKVDGPAQVDGRRTPPRSRHP